MDNLQIEGAERDEMVAGGDFARAVEVNTHTLAQLIAEVRSLRQAVTTDRPAALATGEPSDHDDHDRRDEDENRELRSQIDQLQAELRDLRDQNEDLARQVASSQIRKSVVTEDSSSVDALSWEGRKALILQQLENESFDAESFISEIGADTPGSAEDGEAEPIVDPIEHVRQMHQKLEHHESELKRRDQEIGELRCLLEQKPSNGEAGVAFGAAAIAEMVDSDELVREEREKLQRLQEEWEAKFRQAEVAASLERAKLSRERQELALKAAELEEQLEQLRKVNRDLEGEGRTPSRRWLAALGIQDSGE